MTDKRSIDASVLALAMIGRDADAGHVREALIAMKCHAPHLIDAEFGNVLRKRTRAGDVTLQQARTALMAARSIIDVRYPHVGNLSELAWAMRDNLSFYDALYVAWPCGSTCRCGRPIAGSAAHRDWRALWSSSDGGGRPAARCRADPVQSPRAPPPPTGSARGVRQLRSHSTSSARRSPPHSEQRSVVVDSCPQAGARCPSGAPGMGGAVCFSPHTTSALSTGSASAPASVRAYSKWVRCSPR